MPDAGSYSPPVSYTPCENVASAITGPVSGELLTCLMIACKDLQISSIPRILKSFYLYNISRWIGTGAGEKTHFSTRLKVQQKRRFYQISNQPTHYVNDNPGIRQAVNELNDWEGDVEAILMSENETITKLHNKGSNH